MKTNTLKYVIQGVVIASLVLGLAACAAPTPPPPTAAPTLAPQPTAAPPPTAAPKKLRASAIFAAPLATAPFDRSGCEGLKAMGAKYNIETSCIDQVDYAQVSATARNLASEGVDLVVFSSGGMASSLLEVPPEFPKTMFVVVSSVSELPKGASNAAGWDIQYYDMGYLAGLVAALQSKTGKAGCITGQDIPPTTSNCSGMFDGAKSINPDFETMVAYTGDWVDVAKNKETAKAMIAKGADVFLAPAGASGIGTIQAADEAGLSYIGYIEDENYRAPNTVLTSQLVDFVAVYDQLGQLFTTGKLEAKIYPVTIASGLIKLAPFRGRVQPGVEQKVTDFYNKLKSGEVKLTPVLHDFTK